MYVVDIRFLYIQKMYANIVLYICVLYLCKRALAQSLKTHVGFAYEQNEL